MAPLLPILHSSCLLQLLLPLPHTLLPISLLQEFSLPLILCISPFQVLHIYLLKQVVLLQFLQRSSLQFLLPQLLSLRFCLLLQELSLPPTLGISLLRCRLPSSLLLYISSPSLEWVRLSLGVPSIMVGFLPASSSTWINSYKIHFNFIRSLSKPAAV